MKEFSEYHIEKYIQGLLNLEEVEELESEFEFQPELKQKIITLKGQKSKTSFDVFKTNHIEGLDKEVLQTYESSSWINYCKWSSAVAALLVFAFVFNLMDEKTIELDGVEQVVFKGRTSIHLSLQGKKMNNKEVVFAKAGDVLNLKYRGASSHVLVLYRDDAGKWESYWGGQSSVELKIQSKWALHSNEVVLDSNWTQEELLLLWSDNKFFTDDVLEGLDKGPMNPTINIQRYFMERK
jgi:hypothetical protein